MKLRNITLSFVLALFLALGSAFASGKVNINTASQQELEMLSGVGPATAVAIIEYRESSGSFSTVDELKKVKGIGDKKLETLAEHITLSDAN